MAKVGLWKAHGNETLYFSHWSAYYSICQPFTCFGEGLVFGHKWIGMKIVGMNCIQTDVWGLNLSLYSPVWESGLVWLVGWNILWEKAALLELSTQMHSPDGRNQMDQDSLNLIMELQWGIVVVFFWCVYYSLFVFILKVMPIYLKQL